MLSTLLGFWLVVYSYSGMVVLPPGADSWFVYGTKARCEKAAEVLALADPGLHHVCVPNNYEVSDD